jgi:hypothetical protein
VFPQMSPERLQELADDIKVNRLKALIESRSTDEGWYVIDGKNRLDALELLGEQLIDDKGEWTHRAREFINFGGRRTDVEIVAEVAAYNNRRDLTESQRPIIAARLATMGHGGDRRSKQRASMPVETTVSQAAEMLDVGERTVKQAKKVLRDAPEQVPAIESGKTTVGGVLRKLLPKKRTKEPEQPIPPEPVYTGPVSQPQVNGEVQHSVRWWAAECNVARAHLKIARHGLRLVRRHR